MKIIKKISENIVLHETKLGSHMMHIISLLVFDVPLAITGLFLMSLAFIMSEIDQQQTLNCTRLEATQVNCRVQEKRINEKNEKPPIQLTGAELIEQEEFGENGSYKVYQIELYSKTGKQYFGYGKQDNAELKTVVNQINLFITNPNQRIFQVQQSKMSQDSLSSSMIWFIVSLMLLVFSIYSLYRNIQGIFFYPVDKTWDFDRNLNKLTVTEKFLFNRRKKTEYSLAQPSLEINSYDYIDSDGDEHTTYTLYFISDEKEKLVLYLGISQELAEQWHDVITEFLNLNIENPEAT
ncbi:MAG: hypothetical protein ACSI46_06395 [Gloeotrichia echinulata DVL01]|jgi:hypothetical protein|nr:hypothetical protein [Gloeotrichia echinulata DEX184]